MGTFAITGTASGIGAATTTRMQNAGHRVIGVDLRDADIAADLSNPDGRNAAIEGVLDACDGRLDGFIPCAGVGGTASAELTVRINYYGTMAVLAGLRGALEAGDGAAVVMISSNSTTMTPGLTPDSARVYLDGAEDDAVAHFADKGWLAYPAGKLAISYWVRSNAPGWIASGVRVNAIAPGVTDTAMLDDVSASPEAKAGLDMIPIPIGRWADPDEIAAAIEFMASPSASYVIGQTLFVDGGTDVVLQPFSHPHPLPG